MADYPWNTALLRRVFLVPEEVADKHLRLASAAQLKVLLWLSRHDGEFDEEACARAVGVSAADCRDALRYWVDADVLMGKEPPVTPTTAITAPTVPMPRPPAVKPQMPEVLERRKNNSNFAYLLDEVGARLGRPLSPGDMETLLYLLDTAGLPVEVILLVVGYAASSERFSMRYIEKVALDWADRGIVTIAAAEEYLCLLERSETALRHVQTVCGLDKPPLGSLAFSAAKKWVYDWNVSDDVLRLAYAVCCNKTGRFQAKYMDKILENWRDQGADTAEKVAELCGKSLAQSTATTDDSEYEELVANYVPVYKKKVRKGERRGIQS